MYHNWIYFNEKNRMWQVKYWDEHKGSVVLAEYRERGDAYAHAAWGVIN